MFLQLSDIRTELQNRLKQRTIGTMSLDLWANMAQDRIALRMDPDHLLVEEDVTTVASSPYVYLSYDFNKVTQGINITEDMILDQWSVYQVDNAAPARDQEGSIYAYAQCEQAWVKAQPSSASVVTVVSTSASDTVVKVRINGIVAGVQDTELLTLTGTTPLAGSKSFTSINSVVKDSVSAGKITATTNSGAITLVEIPASVKGRAFNKIQLYQTPADSVTSLRFRGYRKPFKMVNNEDFPELPELWHEAVLIQAEVIGNRDLFRLQMASNIEERVLEPMIRELEKQMGNKRRTRSPVLVGTRLTGSISDWGRLGSKYGD
jgi:hypothetical protein